LLLAEGGLPLPTWPTLLAAAATAGSVELAEIVAAGFAGIMAADVAWYRGGRKHGRRALQFICRISLSPDSCVRQTEANFLRLGPWSLVATKFIPGLSNLTVAVAGIARTRLPVFLVLNSIGALLFVGVPVVLGHLFHDAVADVLTTLAALGKAGAVLVAAAFGLYLVSKWWQRWQFARQLRMDRITVAELAAMIERGGEPVILDVRPTPIRRRDGIIPGSLPAAIDELDPRILGAIRDREIVIYCACPNEASAAFAAKHLKQAGFKKIRPLLGGIDAWEAAGHTIARLAA
jgi:membrane protein DedA with SNARE-associated domain/rhodanese-related sulfurtransferase